MLLGLDLVEPGLVRDARTILNCSGGLQTSDSHSYYNSYYTARLQRHCSPLGDEPRNWPRHGLDHAGTTNCNGQPIMYLSSTRYTVCGHIVPQADDVNGINALYP